MGIGDEDAGASPVFEVKVALELAVNLLVGEK